MNKSFKVNYYAKDFNLIKEELKQYASRYYSESLADLSDASINSFLIDSVSYVGDVLSYYLDFQTNETFLSNALERKNVLKLAKSLGYKSKDYSSACGKVAMYMILPSKVNISEPDFSKAPIIKKGTELATQSSVIFTTTEDVRIDKYLVGKNYVVARTNNVGVPTHYAIKVYVPIVSGKIRSTTIDVKDFVKFNKIGLDNPTIVEIISVTDSDNNQYYEVPNLAQNIVYRPVLNPEQDSEPRYILKPMSALRRFVFDRDENDTYLIFGSKKYAQDDDNTIDPIAEPTKFIINKYNNDFLENDLFDPNVLLNGDNFGIGPENTTLTIFYRENNQGNNNAKVGEVVELVNLRYDFDSTSEVDSITATDILSNVQIVNEEPIIGQSDNISLDEIKDLAGQIFTSQGRAVTAKDYETLAYMMPQKYGFLKRVKAERDPTSLKNNLNMYVCCIDSSNSLARSNTKIKENLKTWLQNYKIITDTVDIIDAKIINLGIEFNIKVDPFADKSETLELVRNQLLYYFSFKPQIGQAFSLIDVFKEIRKINSVMDVESIKVVNKTGTGYSNVYFNVRENTTKDGNYIKIPKNAIYEVRYLTERTPDIVGNVL